MLFYFFCVSVDENGWCDHSNETSSAVLSHGTIYLVCIVVLTFESVDEILKVFIQMKAVELLSHEYFPCGTVYYAVQGGCNV